MARIIGTNRADSLSGTRFDDLIRGRGGDDGIDGRVGNDRLYGDDGNDTISDWYGRNEIYGGRGNDTIYLMHGRALGGVGDDSFIMYVGGDATMIGGSGNDTFEGYGRFWGDEGPGIREEVAGNDTFLMYADADGVWARGGLGRDQFNIVLDTEAATVAVIDDFRHGKDKLEVYSQPPDGETPSDIFGYMDANHNGVLEGTDHSDRHHVWVDYARNTITLDSNDDTVVIRGVTQITMSDWMFNY